MTTLERIAQPTPTFFKTIRNVGLTLAAVSAALLAAPVALPAIITSIAGYLAVAAGVMTAVSQTAVKNDND